MAHQLLDGLPLSLTAGVRGGVSPPSSPTPVCDRLLTANHHLNEDTYAAAACRIGALYDRRGRSRGLFVSLYYELTIRRILMQYSTLERQRQELYCCL